jgi:hypothetical protein
MGCCFLIENGLIYMTQPIAMTYPINVDKVILEQWAAQKLAPETITGMLKEMGFDPDSITTHLRVYKKLRNAKRQFTGFVCMGIGAFLGFASCALTLANLFPSLHSMILFGLTSLAILIIVAGMYLVFE